MTPHKDGKISTPHCVCDEDCEFPCWQRVGITPPCESCGCDVSLGSPYDDAA